MVSRRAFLQTTSVLGGAALAFKAHGIEQILEASAAVADQAPDVVAKDELYWGQIQQAFELDRTLINLNTGHHCSSPRVVMDAYKRYLEMENLAPVYYAGNIGSRLETIRRELADEFGCDPEEMAMTRNASESLQIVQNGLDLAPGDEVITTEQDYPRMLTTWDQRMRRDKIKVTRLQFPVPTTFDDLYSRFEKVITPKTKVFHFCHITNLTGQLFPVQRLSRLARQRGIVTIVDGAHAGGQFPYKLRDFECDAYGVSLHKWLLAPLGSGLLFVRKDMIPKFWPLQAAPTTSDTNIRKFEEIGTAPMAVKAGIGDALAFHRAITVERKAARLFYLTSRWGDQLKTHPKIRMHSSMKPGETWGVATVGIEGMEASKIAGFLMDKYKIIVAGLAQGAMPGQQFPYQGIRVTPNIYTATWEVDRFVQAMQELLKTA